MCNEEIINAFIKWRDARHNLTEAKRIQLDCEEELERLLSRDFKGFCNISINGHIVQLNDEGKIRGIVYADFVIK